MRSISIKVTIIFLILCIMPINNTVRALYPSEGLPNRPNLDLGDLNQYAGDGGSSEVFDNKVNKIISIIQIIASIVSVAVLIALGIKYMMGSVEAKAEYKRTMIPYLVGACLVFGITNITSLLYYIARHMIYK